MHNVLYNMLSLSLRDVCWSTLGWKVIMSATNSQMVQEKKVDIYREINTNASVTNVNNWWI